MTSAEFGSSIAALGLSQVKAARLFDVDPRTVRRWTSGKQSIPKAVEIALELLVQRVFAVGAEKVPWVCDAHGVSGVAIAEARAADAAVRRKADINARRRHRRQKERGE